MASARILISESDPDVRRLLVVHMERLGHEPVVLRRGDMPPRGDVLLLEPAARACVSAARFARLFYPDLPVVSMGPPPADGDFLADGPLLVVEKPFTLEALESAVATFAATPVA